jgi:hypothetical protein
MARQMQAQAAAIAAGPAYAPAAPPAYGDTSAHVATTLSLYPSLEEYMGLDMRPETIERKMPTAVAVPQVSLL